MYMVISSLTSIPGFSVEFFVQPIYNDYGNWTYFYKKKTMISHCHLNLLRIH